MHLSGADEFFTHQTARPHSMVETSDPSWRERYWVSFQDTERGDTVLTLGLGRYPNQNVMEAFVCLSQGDTQRNLRLSRTLLPDSHEMVVGPLSCEVVEPLRELRFRLEENESGISFDLSWLATMEPILESPFYQVNQARASYDAIRYVQHGRGSGTLSSPHGAVEVTPERWWSERDHSWGTRPLPRAEGQPPGERPDWRMLLFCPLQLPDFALHLYLQESEPGRPVHLSAGLVGPIGKDDHFGPVIAVEHDLEWVEGAAAPTLSGGELALTMLGGERLEFGLTALPGRAHLRGGGYEGWAGWKQGHWRGDLTSEYDEWDLSDRTKFYRHAKAGSDHLVRVEHRGQTGYGVIEYMVLPGYGRYAEALAPPKPADS
jgi:hypothetical protein